MRGLRKVATGVLVVSAFASGCTEEELAPLPPGGLPGPPEWNREVTPPSDDAARDGRAACAYGKGALPAETQGASYPNGAAIPIDHVLVVMMENRSFDHYFQKLPEYGQPDVDVAPAGFSSPDPNGVPVPIYHESNYCIVDTNHEWKGSHEQVNDGAMDGFVRTNHGWGTLPPGGSEALRDGARAMGYFDATDLPFYYFLANEFSIADRFFCSLQGPTFPNRSYLYAGSSFGVTGGDLPPGDATTVFDYLEARQVDWKVYKSPNGAPGFATFFTQYLKYQADHVRLTADFLADAAAGTLPSFAFIDPGLGVVSGDWDNDDEHPPADPQVGQRFVGTIVDALVKSPAWPRTALFITYDEHGGLYDHVEPPPACKPDDLEPVLAAGDPAEHFDELGMRVPLIVVSPYAKQHHVSHETYDLTSILRFIEARFVMPALTGRDANALAPWDMFDFDHPPHLTPPALAVPEVDPAKYAACEATFGG